MRKLVTIEEFEEWLEDCPVPYNQICNGLNTTESYEFNLTDVDFSSTTTEVVERHFTGFTDMGYNPDLEIWAAMASFVLVFKNNR